MVKTLTGPINMEQAIDFTKSITEAFYGLERPRIKTNFWDKNIMRRVSYNGYSLSSDKSVGKLYHSANSKALSVIAANPAEFATILNVENFKGRDDLEIRIYNQTMLEDAIAGQTFPATTKKFLFYTRRISCSKYWMNKFIEYRNKMIDQAQERLNQSISGVAYNLMKDLHP